MATSAPVVAILGEVIDHLRRLKKRFAVVGGLAVSVRAEVRFTRDLDLAVAVLDDAELDALVADLRAVGYEAVALVEQDAVGRVATVRLASRRGMRVDLLAASSGIEREVVARAVGVPFGHLGEVPVARAEELLAMKVLSVVQERPQDRIDAISLLLVNPGLDLDAVRDDLRLIAERGYARGQDLIAKLDEILAAAARA